MLFYFDTETTGLTWDSELLSYAVLVDGEAPFARTRTWQMTERELLEQLVVDMRRLSAGNGPVTRMVGYNIENFKGGYDVPFIRMRIIRNNIKAKKEGLPLIAWPFAGVSCFDLLPAIEKKLCTNHNFPPTLDSLTAEQASDVVTALGCLPPAVEAKTDGGKPKKEKKLTKIENIKLLQEYEETNGTIDLMTQFKIPCDRRDCNTLDFVYEILEGPELVGIDDESGEHMCGAKVPLKWAEYLITHNEEIPKLISRYNMSDVMQTKYVYDLFKEYIPKHDRASNSWTEL
jgi:hypothetical protein